MPRRRYYPNNSHPHLPPEEYRIFDLHKDELLETPIDMRGLVDLDATINMVCSTVTADYKWESNLNDVHHLQWYAAKYKEHEQAEIAIEFRELVNRKTYIPRVFHNWIHRITIPPPVPSVEVMQYAIDSQNAVIDIYKTTSEAVRITRKKLISDKVLEIRLNQAFENFNNHLENAKLIPEEFQIIKLDDLNIRSVEEMLELNKSLGRMALDKIPIRDKHILSATIAA